VGNVTRWNNIVHCKKSIEIPPKFTEEQHKEKETARFLGRRREGNNVY
jgi:hypothetical protein